MGGEEDSGGRVELLFEGGGLVEWSLQGTHQSEEVHSCTQHLSTGTQHSQATFN